MNLKSNEFTTPFIGIIEISSEITLSVMERCVTRKLHDEMIHNQSTVSECYKSAYMYVH